MILAVYLLILFLLHFRYVVVGLVVWLVPLKFADMQEHCITTTKKKKRKKIICSDEK